jgi:hypothetical protein
LTKLSRTLSSISKIILLLFAANIVGCAAIQRPDAWVCGINGKSKKMLCYNLKKDYDEDGTLKAGAEPLEKKDVSLQSLTGGLYFSSEDTKKIKVWLQDMRDYAKNHCQ